MATRPTKNKKLKIGVIVGPFPCTSETFILNHITRLIDLGHDVDVFAFGKSEEKQIVHECVTEYGLDKNVTYLFPIPYDKEGRRKAILSVLIRNVFRHPIWIYRCFKMKRFERLSSMDSLILAGYFMKKRYDVIHCHFGTNAKKMCFLKDILKPIKYIVTFHGFDIRKGLEEPKGYYHDLFDKADHVISICEYNKIKLRELGCPDAKIADIPNSIDTEVFSRLERRNSKTFIIVTVARFVQEKNYEFALNIVKTLKESGIRNFKYVIIGDGPLKEEMEAKIKEYGIEDYVELKGALKHKEVRDVLSQSDLFLLASRNEAFPTVVLEAQSMGIPVVATDVGGLNQTMVDGKSGFLIPLDDVKAAKSRIVQLIEDENLRGEFGREGRRFVMENFDVKKISQMLTNMYDS